MDLQNARSLSLGLWLPALFVFLSTAASLNEARAQFSSVPHLSRRVTIDEIAEDAQRQLARIDDLLADGQFDEVVENLTQLMTNQGDALVAVAIDPGSANAPPADPKASAEESPRRFISLREYGQWLLARHSAKYPEVLARYRQRIDSLAERWTRDGIQRRDRALLARVAEELAISSSADDALLALGDLELERGHIDAARKAWERISPRLRVFPAEAKSEGKQNGTPWWLVLRGVDWKKDGAAWSARLKGEAKVGEWLAMPDADLDLAAVWVRLVLASLLEGNRVRAKIEAEVLRELYPEAKGVFAGREVVYSARAIELLQESESWSAAAASPAGISFAGNLARQGIADSCPDIGGSPLWEIDLGEPWRARDRIGFGRLRVAEDLDVLLSYHPIAQEGKLFFHTGSEVRGCELRTGKPLWTEGGILHQPRKDKHEVADVGRGRGRELSVGVPRFTLTIAAGQLFARAGSPETRPLGPDDLGKLRGYLAGINLLTEGRGAEGLPLDPDGGEWAFEGTPVADAARFYVAMRRADTQIYVACFERGSSRLLWRRRVCSAETLGRPGETIISSLLLSLHEDTLYFNTNAGAVAALEIESGHIRWLVTYPRCVTGRGNPQQLAQHWFRDLNPCLVHQGLVICAPADLDRIIALDAATGLTIWETPAGVCDDIIHLLGVGHGQLIASGDYLYWIDIATGRVSARFPGNGDPAGGGAKPSPGGYGRGVLCGDRIYWPTRERIFVFRQEIGSDHLPTPARQPIELAARGISGGNLLIAEGVLVIAGPRKIWAFDEKGPEKGGKE